MKCKIIKILAWGSYKSCMTIKLENGEEITTFISRDKYYHLKNLGIPTAQKLGREKCKK